MAKALDEYTRKRNFTATPEPSGARKSRRRNAADVGETLQFCIQKHDASHLHYDFRLELNGALKSWAIPKGPCLDPKVRRLAVHVEDHPIDYATFEGHIPEGHYGAGDVIVWDRGIWTPQGDPNEGYEKGKLKFALDGEKLSGAWNLVRTKMAGKKEQWFLIKSKDAAARPEADYDVLEDKPDSVLSERTLTPRARGKSRKADVDTSTPVKAPARRRSKRGEPTALEGAKKAKLPETFAPQLATLVESAPEGDWRYEIKFDGYRILARIRNGEVRLFTRNGHDWTDKMPRQAEAIAALGLTEGWLDGEVVVADEEGLPDFQALQNAFEANRSERILYYLFDAPYLNGMDLRRVSLEQRRTALAEVLNANDSALLRYSDDFAEDAQSMLTSACQMKLEGLIGKRAGSAYTSRRSSSWIKIKCQNRQEFVVVGYTEPKGARSGFGALLLALHDDDSGELLYAGKVGTGFNEDTLKTLLQQLKPLETARAPLSNPPKGAEARGVHWLKPELLCEVAFAQMTREGIVRHSVFHGLRDDKPAKRIGKEAPKRADSVAAEDARGKSAASKSNAQKGPRATDVEGIRISHPDRVIDKTSGGTKLDIARYYAEMAPWMSPEMSKRPVALVRAPDGIEGELFFQKHADRRAMPHVGQVKDVSEPKPLFLVDNAKALVGAAQMGVVEVHGWNATVPKLDKPDRFVLDLDPDPALPWKHMIEATQLTLTLLDELGLRAYIKTSGGKGMHIVVPLSRRQEWDAVKDFTKAIAQHMADVMPARFSAVSGPKNRVGKIFIDYLRNGRGATSVAAYSVRAREGLPVSVPIYRDELEDLKGANQWTVRNVAERLAALGDDDPWAEMGSVKQTITVKMRKQLGMR
ncbi:DNA ligase D [Pseudomonas matsuisoli]|uniref:DNA ligase (ATP) n=1 Tax=Pseudomonas matsuisoli TaxID=1515666 RepID=A0A917PNG3_9PSED|nr:DNA ligase D [Pseudomonas matsuisoli]GGJ85926.1 multifunctional non-homologous end joining protein LigD [Pseudomonas matsuisoli]